MVVCNGRGDNGSHCCTINGETCPLLTIDQSGTPRCSVWGQWDEPTYQASAAAAWFAERYPGYTCADWPQNIPELAGRSGPGMCCWKDGV